MDTIEHEVQKLIAKGNFILQLTESEQIKHVLGINKFRKKIKREISFLETVTKRPQPVDAYVKCSNLLHLEALIRQAIKEEECVSVMHVFKYVDLETGLLKKLTVDIVSKGGSRWNKVRARNARALTINSSDDCHFGVRSIIDQAKDYVECSQENQHLFRVPEIVFHFASGIEMSLANNLKALGINTEGNLIDDMTGVSILPESTANETCRIELNALNLDVTAMMAYVASSTNGGCYAKLSSPTLSLQLENERKNHVKQMLDDLFEGKKLFCCTTAYDSFVSIIKIIAGPGEKKRGEEFLKRVTAVPDNPSKRALELEMEGKVKNRSIIIFGTGDTLKLPTVSANVGFIRAARHQGVDFAVFTHESRSLTEAKEISHRLTE